MSQNNQKAWNSTLRRGDSRLKRSGFIKKGGKLRHLSTEGRKVNERYIKKKAWFLAQPENKYCHICIALNLHPNISTIVHHYRGRSKRVTDDERFFIPSCKHHELWPHQFTVEARTLGLLSPATEYGTAPRPGEIFTLPKRY